MKKVVAILMVMSIALMGCTTSEKENIRVLTPNGAPALALVNEYEDINKEGEIKIVEGSDLISAELVKKDSSYDVIIAPINLGCQLIAKEQSDFRLAGVLTWGNLYLVENEEVSNQQFVAFGEMAVPGKILSLMKDSSKIIKNTTLTYYNALSDVQAQMLSGNYQYALLAEPAASATIAKAKQLNMSLKISASMQDLYQQQTHSQTAGYPQAAIFVKDKALVQSFLDDLKTFTNEEALKAGDDLEAKITEIGVETFGVPNAKIAVNTWERQNIHYQDANEVKADIEILLKQFNIAFSDEMLAK
ncbi:MAG: hypothetical protein EOM50_03515 [Erysipelotrichia bacterium]|nr:hypothetical protein [Erysipelotrichia bacterium]NCC54082.1 hypothetical protein [Erysipelotrichia bacterium]